MCSNSTNDTCRVDFLQGLGYTPLFILGLVVNTAAVHAFVAKRRTWTDVHIYMFNLAIADLALVLLLPFRILDAFLCLPKTGFCTFLLFVHFINMYASIMTTTAISIQRYLVVRFPMRARSWRRRKEVAVAVCIVIWALLLSICAIFRRENYPEKLWTCYERCKDRPLRLEFILILVLLGYLVPLLIILFCSSQIIRTLSKADGRSEEKKSIVGMVTANAIVFVVCYTPIHVGFLVNYMYTPPVNWQLLYIPTHMYLLVSEWIASTNCCFDSISYYFLLKHFYSEVNGIMIKRERL